jgi:hypothetical protein
MNTKGIVNCDIVSSSSREYALDGFLVYQSSSNSK